MAGYLASGRYIPTLATFFFLLPKTSHLGPYQAIENKVYMVKWQCLPKIASHII